MAERCVATSDDSFAMGQTRTVDDVEAAVVLGLNH